MVIVGVLVYVILVTLVFAIAVITGVGDDCVFFRWGRMLMFTRT